MKTRRVVIRERTYIPLAAAAACCEVDAEWLEEVFEHGLLGAGAVEQGERLIELAMLERVPEIWRLHQVAGVNLAGILLWIEE